MKELIVFVIAAIVCWQVGAAVEWKNLDKEHPDFGPKEQMKKAKLKKSMEDALRKYTSLKQPPDPRVAQEAKKRKVETLKGQLMV